MPLKRKDLLGIADLTVEEINLILDTAETFRDINTRRIKKSSHAARQNHHQSLF